MEGANDEARTSQARSEEPESYSTAQDSPNENNEMKPTSDTNLEDEEDKIQDEDMEVPSEDGSQDPHSPLPDFLWEDFDARFQQMVSERDHIEQELMNEFQNLVEVCSQQSG